MKPLSLVIAAVLLASLAPDLYGQSQKPPQTERVQTNQQSDSSGASKEKTKEPAAKASNPQSVAPEIKPPDLKKESSDGTGHSADEASEYWPFLIYGTRLKITDSLLALFTFWLVVIGAWQGYQIKRTVDLAREEFSASHRPEIRLKHIWLATPDGERSFDRLQDVSPVKVRLDIVNRGAVVGFVRAVNMVVRIIPENGSLPQRPPYNEPDIRAKTLLNDFPLTLGRTLTGAFSDGQILSASDIANIYNGHCRLYFVGTIEYWWGTERDNLRQTAFCRYLSGPSGRFRTDPDPDYEYQD